MTQLSVQPNGLVGGLNDTPGFRVAHLDQVPSSAVSSLSSRSSRPAVAGVVAAAVAAAVALLVLGVTTTPVDSRIAASVVLAWPVLLAAQGCFVARPLGDPVGARATRVVRAGALLGLLSWSLALLAGPTAAPAVMLPVTAAVTASGLACAVLHRRRRPTRVVLAGDAADVSLAVAELSTRPDLDVVAACVTSGTVGPTAEYAVHGDASGAVDHSLQHEADALVVLPGCDVSPALVRRLQWQAETHGVGMYVGTGLLDVAPFRMSLTTGPGLGMVQVRPSARTGLRRVTKEVVERTAAALGLCVLLPVLLTVAWLVRHDSPGPALFRQQRVGRNGELFTMVKFRTMTCTAEVERDRLAQSNEGHGVLFKIRSDPRVTRVGRVLRRYSLDELPQLWNVVAGDMALVGPRPALPDEVARYDVDPRRRLAVKPGLTGLWQVSGRSDLTWEQTVRLDLRYVDNWSLRLDAAILCRTLRAVLAHRGAY